MSRFALGCYTRHARLDARGRGVVIVDWDEETDRHRILDTGSGIENPSYLHWQSGSRMLYTLSETEERHGAAAAYRLSDAGKLERLRQQEGRGRSDCHLTVLPGRRRLYTTSYSDGRLTSYELTNRGVGPVVMSRRYDGRGPNAERQEASHAHQVTLSPYGPHLYVCDLGADAVWLHAVDSADDETRPPIKALAVPPGCGPRHLAYDPVLPAAYVQCELIARLLVTAIDPDTGEMTILEEHDTSAPDRMDISAPAAVKVHPSGRTLALSNRFDDTIAVFAIDRSSGTPALNLAGRFPCGGNAPRDIEFNRTGTRLFIANQDSHVLTCRHFDGESGLPADGWAEPMETGSPVCVVMLD